MGLPSFPSRLCMKMRLLPICESAGGARCIMKINGRLYPSHPSFWQKEKAHTRKMCWSPKCFFENMISSFAVLILSSSLTSASLLRRVSQEASPSPITLTNGSIWPSSPKNSSLQLSELDYAYVCQGGYYGEGADADSCDEALRTMGIAPGARTAQFTWGERSRGHFDIPLPQRWVSC